jgi:hypothetical protein
MLNKHGVFAPTATLPPITDVVKDKQISLWRPEFPAVTRDCIWPHHLPKIFDLSSLPEPVLPWLTKNAHSPVYRTEPRPRRQSRFFPSLPACSADSKTIEISNRPLSQLPADHFEVTHDTTPLPSSSETRSGDAAAKEDEDLQTAINLWRVLSFEARRLNRGSGTSDTEITRDTILTPEIERRDVPAAHDTLNRAECEDRGAAGIHAKSLTGLANDAARPFGTLLDSAICMNVPVPWHDSGSPLVGYYDSVDIPLPGDTWPLLEPQQRRAPKDVRMAVPTTPNATMDDV